MVLTIRALCILGALMALPPMKRPLGKPVRPDPKVMRDRLKAQSDLRKRVKRLGAPAIFEANDERQNQEPDTSIDGLNSAIASLIDPADQEPIKKGKGNRLSGKELADWQAARARVKQIRQRQADAGYYVVFVFDSMEQAQAFCGHMMSKYGVEAIGALDGSGANVTIVFDTGMQATAFVLSLMRNHVITRHGDLFLDGRHIAAAFGIPLPDPEYRMTINTAGSSGGSKTMAKIPKGYKSK